MANKKTFKDNPALAFITSGTETEPQQGRARATQSKEQTRTNGRQEVKSRRLNLLLQPSILEDISKIAYLERTSVNDLINTALKSYAADRADEIKKYDEIFTKED